MIEERKVIKTKDRGGEKRERRNGTRQKKKPLGNHMEKERGQTERHQKRETYEKKYM